MNRHAPALWYEVEGQGWRGLLTHAQVTKLILDRHIGPATGVRSSLHSGWAMAVDHEALAPLFGVQQVHGVVPAVLLPPGLLLLFVSFGLDRVNWSGVVARGAVESALWVTLGAWALLAVGLGIPCVEYLVQRIQLARLREGGEPD